MKGDTIVTTNESDLAFIYHLFEEAIAYQKRHGYPAWRGYDKSVLKKDIEDHLQYKLLNGDEIAYLFSICYSDKIIWREKEKGDAIYLHRMVVNPKFKGLKQFGKILKWIQQHCRDKHLRYIRMDTWSGNPVIINYYKSFGFYVVDYFRTPDSIELPIQQRDIDIVLLEMEPVPDIIINENEPV